MQVTYHIAQTHDAEGRKLQEHSAGTEDPDSAHMREYGMALQGQCIKDEA